MYIIIIKKIILKLIIIIKILFNFNMENIEILLLT